MTTLSFTATALAHSFSYALLSSLWQALLIYGLLYLLLRLFSTAGAGTRYMLSTAAFLSVSFLFAYTWVGRYYELHTTTVFLAQSAADSSSVNTHSSVVNAVAPSTISAFRQFLLQVDQYVPAIMLIYYSGLLFMLIRVLLNFLQLRALSRTGVVSPDSYLLAFVDKWKQQLGISRPVKLLLSARVSVPVMLGTLRPIILLPVATINSLSTEQVEAILLHELAHIRRHDYLVNLFQVVIETLLFFNPFIWLISAVIRRERELCADDMVVASASSPLHYATALAMLEDNRMYHNSLSLAATGTNNQLFNRIKRIMEMKKENTPHSRASVILVTVIAASLLVAMISFTPSFAQKPREEEKKTIQKKTAKTVTNNGQTKTKVVTKTITTDEDGNEGDNVNVNISLDDDDKSNKKAKVLVVTTKKNDKKGSEKKYVKKEIVISSDDGSFDKARLDAEIDRVRQELSAVDWQDITADITDAIADITDAIAEVSKELNVEKLAKEISIQIKREIEDNKDAIHDSKREIVRKKYTKEIDTESPKEKDILDKTDQLDDMLQRMQKDGLIDMSDDFKVEKKEDALYINGKKQSEQIYKKYRHYMSEKGVTVSGNKHTLNVSKTE